jgi:serine/threonine protein kinase
MMASIETFATPPASLSRRGEMIAASYELGDVLGVGGMGVVYSAVQRSLDRVVAVKVPRPELADDELVRQRLRSEAFVGAALNHRNVVHVFDFGTDQGVPFVVMEYVRGPRLSQMLVELGPLPVATALWMTRQILNGLEDAHANGIVHADVKCDNVLVELRRDGGMTPRLIDFGIARFVQASDDEPSDVVTGTAEYLAPEVICGSAPTAAADVYATGVILYELVSGSTPFSGATSTEVMTRRLEDEVVPLSLRCPDREIPAAFDRVVMRALSREPRARFRDAASFGEALDNVLAQLPAGSPTRSHVETMPPIFTTEATTATMRSLSARMTTTPVPTAKPREADDVVVVAYLERARGLVDSHQLAGAIAELETGVLKLRQAPRATPVWRLQLALAALYDGLGNRCRAREVVRQARERATHAGSATGCERADRLAMRLGRRRSPTRRPW